MTNLTDKHEFFKAKAGVESKTEAINDESHLVKAQIPSDYNIIDKKTEKTNNSDEEEIKSEFSIFLQAIDNLLKGLCEHLRLSTKHTSFIVDQTNSFLSKYLSEQSSLNKQQQDWLHLHLQQFLGKDINQKTLLAKRAALWLGLNQLISNEDYAHFVSKLITLGQMLSEAKGINFEQPKSLLNKDAAKSQRNKLLADGKFTKALTNKMHPQHKDALKQLRTLNQVIVSQ